MKKVIAIATLCVLALLCVTNAAATVIIPATAASVWTTDTSNSAKLTFNIGQTVCIHWNANGNVNITTYGPSGQDSQWLNYGNSGTKDWVPSQGVGVYYIVVTGAPRYWPIAVGSVSVIPEVPIGAAVIFAGMLGAFAMVARKKSYVPWR